MLHTFDPANCYWVQDDGTLYSGRAQTIVPATDGDYVAWCAAGMAAVPWPRDAAGDQTEQALQDVLTPHGMFASLTAYAEDAKWRREIGGITVAGLSVATDDRSKLMIAGARLAALADPAWTTQWHVGGGVLVPLAAPEVVAISDAVLAHVDACFAAFGAVVSAIEAGTITAPAEIDTAFAAA